MNNNDWYTTVKRVHQNYAKAQNIKVDKKKLLAVLYAFRDLYNQRSTCREEEYYLSNLIGTGAIEGRREDVLGTVPQAVKRTEQFIFESVDIYSHQAEIICRNLINILRKENFTIAIDEVLAPHKVALTDLKMGDL